MVLVLLLLAGPAVGGSLDAVLQENGLSELAGIHDT